MTMIDANNNKLSLVDKFDINMAMELYTPESLIGTRRMRVWADLPLLKLRVSGFKVLLV